MRAFQIFMDFEQWIISLFVPINEPAAACEMPINPDRILLEIAARKFELKKQGAR